MNASFPEGDFADRPTQGQPRGFVLHAIDREFRVSAEAEAVWSWLEDPQTFTRGQVWPYRVEFTPDEAGERAGFHEGGLSNHHGPALCAAGRLTQIDEGRYRELVYFYGSYVGSFRWIRPVRLEFWVEPDGAGSRVRMRFESWVRRPLARAWGWMLERFWSRFGRWMNRAAPRRARRA